MTAQLDLHWRQDAGHSSALSGLSAFAVRAIHAAVESFAGKPAFTAEMVRGELGFSVREEVALHGNAIGAVMTHFARRGKIERTGATVVSQRESSRGRRVAVWRFK